MTNGSLFSGWLHRTLAWPKAFSHRFRKSLQLRSMAFAGALSIVSIMLIGTYMLMSVGNTLFDNRLAQSLDENARATNAAQQVFYNSTATDENALTGLVSQVRQLIQEVAPGSSGRVAILRSTNQESTVNIVQDTLSPAISEGYIRESLREQVGGAENQQFYQTIRKSQSRFPALIVGSQLEIPSAGKYELYTVFDLTEIDETLVFVQTTLVVGGAVLVFLIVLVSWFVVRMTVRPIKLVAETSQQFAAGELTVRIPVSGEDEIATLSESFNNMADSLEEQINQLAELSQLQQRFVSDVSHELRTPLTTIQLASSLIYENRDELEDAAKRSAELLQSQTERFGELLEDLLEISRIDAGAVDPDLERKNMVEVVNESVEAVQRVAKEMGSAIVVATRGGYLDVEMDTRRVRRIIGNLLGNALEHGEAQTIQVLVDSNEEAVAVSVRDWGSGMTEDELAHIFDRFWRADPSRKRTLGGTGLGLSIALEDTNLHRGSLDVWSEKGVGTCFRLTLPLTFQGTFLTSPIALPPDEDAWLMQAEEESTQTQSNVLVHDHTDTIPTLIDHDITEGERDVR